jgi:CRP/FNR family cyclic AMP-dependent transcriptional regulator
MSTKPGQSILFGRYRAYPFTAEGALLRAQGADNLTDTPVVIVAMDIAWLEDPEVAYGVERLRADAERAAAMTHPTVAQAIAFFKDAQRVYVVQQQPEGLPLARIPRAGLDVGFVASAILKMLFLYGYYQETELSGTCLRPGGISLTPSGDLKVDSLPVARLSYIADVIARGGAEARLYAPQGAFTDRASCDDEDRRQAADAFEALLGMLPEKAAAEPAATALGTTLQRLKGAGGEKPISIADATDSVRDVVRWVKGKPPFAAREEQSRQTRRTFRAGALLFKEGDAAQGEGYILEDGLVQISKTDPDGREIFLDLSRPGDIIGEMALLDSQPRMASARAIEPSVVIVINGPEFFGRLEKTDKVARKLIDVLAKRLRYQAGEVARLKGLLGMGKA